MAVSFMLVAFWSLASGWMLLWGLAAAIPVVIHLWNRRQQQEVSWAAMEFLLAAVRKHARRIRLEQWLLLAVRIVVLLILAVALADPLLSMLPRTPVSTTARGRTHTVIVLDGSYSMASRSGELSNLERAKTLAAQIVRGGSQGDGFTLVTMGDPPRAVIPDVVFDAEDVVDELQTMQLRHTGADLMATLDEVARIVQGTAQRHPRFVGHQVCFLTDLGLSTWADVRSPQVRQRLARLADDATLFLYEMGTPARGNLAIKQLSSHDPLATVGNPLKLEVEVENFAEQAQRCKIELLVDGRSVKQEPLEVAAGGTAVHGFSHRFELPGPHSVEARLDEDPLTIDNHRWLGVHVSEVVRVLCVEGKQGAAEFVALALAPQQDGRGQVRPEVVGENALLERDLFEYDCLFLCNIGRFGRQEAEVLYNYVNHGGGLVTILGDRVQAESYNETLGGEITGHRVLPARLGGMLGERPYHFDPLEYQHPIAAPFRGHERSGLLTTPVWRFLEMSPTGDEPQIALAFDNGSAALVTESIGRGRSILFATAASTTSVDGAETPPVPWTAIATSPSFPPLMHEMLRYATGGRLPSRNVLVGQPLTWRLPTNVATAVRIASPDGNSRQVTVKLMTTVLPAGPTPTLFSVACIESGWWMWMLRAKSLASTSIPAKVTRPDSTPSCCQASFPILTAWRPTRRRWPNEERCFLCSVRCCQPSWPYWFASPAWPAGWGGERRELDNSQNCGRSVRRAVRWRTGKAWARYRNHAGSYLALATVGHAAGVDRVDRHGGRDLFAGGAVCHENVPSGFGSGAHHAAGADRVHDVWLDATSSPHRSSRFDRSSGRHAKHGRGGPFR